MDSPNLVRENHRDQGATDAEYARDLLHRCPESHANIINRGFDPVQIKAGIADPHPTKRGADGKPVLGAKYGMHALRHFFASWAIEQGFSPQRLQALLGHASIQMTFDVYGHLFPSPEDDHAKFAAGELAIAVIKGFSFP